MDRENQKIEEDVFKKSDYLSLNEISRECPYSQEYLSLLARRGKIDAVKIGRNWYATKEAVADYCRQQVQNGKISESPFQGYDNLSGEAKFVSDVSGYEKKYEFGEQEEKSERTVLVPLAPVFDDNKPKDSSGKKRIVLLAGSFALTVIVIFTGYHFMSGIDLAGTARKIVLSAEKFAARPFEKFSGFFLDKKNYWVGKGDSESSILFNKELRELEEGVVSDTKERFSNFRDKIVLPQDLHVEDIQRKKIAENENVVIIPKEDKDSSEIVSKLERSFSDKVEVMPDGGQASGVIRVNFKDKDQEDYLYLMVPKFLE